VARLAAARSSWRQEVQRRRSSTCVRTSRTSAAWERRQQISGPVEPSSSSAPALPSEDEAATKVSVRVSTAAPRPSSATAPSGSGCVMMPTMVERKMASSCHALRGTPDGAGMNQMSTPVAMEISSGVMAAPCSGGGAAGAGGPGGGRGGGGVRGQGLGGEGVGVGEGDGFGGGGGGCDGGVAAAEGEGEVGDAGVEALAEVVARERRGRGGGGHGGGAGGGGNGEKCGV
jgi:hypothetical protein